MHREGCFLLPNAWDIGSARILESAGFPAVATTSAGIAFSLGRPDHDFFASPDSLPDPSPDALRGPSPDSLPAPSPDSLRVASPDSLRGPSPDSLGGLSPDSWKGRVDRETMMRRVGEIVAGVAIPVSADLEEGYGESPSTVAATVSMAVAAGAAGGNIEDFTGDRTRPLFDAALATDRIRAARAAIDASGEPFVLVGRTDVLLTGGTLDEAIERANAYLAAGADCAFVPGASDAATIGTIVRHLNGPLNVVMGLTGGALSLADLRDLGVRRVTVGGSIARAMYRHLLNAATELAAHGTFSYANDQLSQTDLNDLFTRS